LKHELFSKREQVQNQHFSQKKHALAINTVSGRNPAPPGMYKTLYMMGFQLPTSTGAGFLKPSTVGKEFI